MGYGWIRMDDGVYKKKDKLGRFWELYVEHQVNPGTNTGPTNDSIWSMEYPPGRIRYSGPLTPQSLMVLNQIQNHPSEVVFKDTQS